MEKHLEFLNFAFYFLVFIVIGLKPESYNLVSQFQCLQKCFTDSTYCIDGVFVDDCIKC